MNPTDPAESETFTVHSLEGVVELTHTSRHLVAVYCRHGFISPLSEEVHGGWTLTMRRCGNSAAWNP